MWRLFRGGVLAVLCTILAACGHAMAGGPVPAVATVVAASWLSACFVLFADRRRGFMPIAVASVSAQLVLHTAFVLAEGVHAGHVPAGSSAGLTMVAGHAVAAVAMAAILAYGEQVVWSLFYVLALCGVPQLVRLVPPGPRARVRVVAEADLPPDSYDARAHPQRGPPAWALA